MNNPIRTALVFHSNHAANALALAGALPHDRDDLLTTIRAGPLD